MGSRVLCCRLGQMPEQTVGDVSNGFPLSTPSCNCESVTQSCPTLCNTMDYSLTGSSVHGILQAEYWSGLPFPSPGDLPYPGINPMSLAWQAVSLPSELQRKPQKKWTKVVTNYNYNDENTDSGIRYYTQGRIPVPRASNWARFLTLHSLGFLACK